MAIAMLFAVTANADVIHETDYETETTAGLGIQPSSMEFTDGGGDFAGQAGLGVSDSVSNSGSFSYVVDTAMTVDNGNGWGGSWSGTNSNSGIVSSGFFADQAAAEAAGPGSQYIDYSAGATFTVTAWAATDAAGVTGGATFAPRLEFQGFGNELFRNDAGQVAATSLTTTFQEFTHSYTLTAADVALADNNGTVGISHVTGTLGVDGLGFNGSTGNIYYDDFVFEVSGANVITVAVPEPSSAVILAGLLGLCGLRRKKN
jgi:hypothetical protein